MHPWESIEQLLVHTQITQGHGSPGRQVCMRRARGEGGSSAASWNMDQLEESREVLPDRLRLDMSSAASKNSSSLPSLAPRSPPSFCRQEHIAPISVIDPCEVADQEHYGGQSDCAERQSRGADCLQCDEYTISLSFAIRISRTLKRGGTSLRDDSSNCRQIGSCDPQSDYMCLKI